MNGDPEKQEKYPKWIRYLLIALALVFIYLVFLQAPPLEPGYEIPYSQFKQLAVKGSVSEIQLKGDIVEGRLRSIEAIGPQGETAQRFRTRIPPFGDESLLPLLEAQGVEVRVSSETGETGAIAILLSLLPWLFLILFFYWVFQRTSRALGGHHGIDQHQDRALPVRQFQTGAGRHTAVSYTHLTLPTTDVVCISRWSPYH